MSRLIPPFSKFFSVFPVLADAHSLLTYFLRRTTFRDGVINIGHTLCYLGSWNRPNLLRSAWHLYEICCNETIDIVINRYEVEVFMQTLRKDPDEIISALSQIDVENATCFLEEDKDRIFEVIRSTEGGFHGVNVKVIGLIRGWVTKTAREAIQDVDRIEPEELSPGQVADIIETASLFRQQGAYKEALAMYRRAMVIREKALGAQHPDTLSVVNSLGNVLENLGELEEALECYMKARRGLSGILGLKHQEVLQVANNIGSVLAAQGKCEEAERFCLDALAGYTETLGSTHVTTLKSISNLGNLRAQMGKLEEARVLYSEALEGYEKVLSPQNPRTLDVVNSLASVLNDMGDLDKAKGLYDRALRGYEMVLGEKHPDALRVMNNIGTLLAAQGHYSEAALHFGRAMRGMEEMLGSDHPEFFRILYNLGDAHYRMGDLIQAEAELERATRGLEERLGSDHPFTRDSRGKHVRVQPSLSKLEHTTFKIASMSLFCRH